MIKLHQLDLHEKDAVFIKGNVVLRISNCSEACTLNNNSLLDPIIRLRYELFFGDPLFSVF